MECFLLSLDHHHPQLLALTVSLPLVLNSLPFDRLIQSERHQTTRHSHKHRWPQHRKSHSNSQQQSILIDVRPSAKFMIMTYGRTFVNNLWGINAPPLSPLIMRNVRKLLTPTIHYSRLVNPATRRIQGWGSFKGMDRRRLNTCTSASEV